MATLEDQGVISSAENGSFRAGVRLIRAFGRWIAADPASDLSHDAVYIGDDSMRLAAFFRDSHCDTLLDAYAGSAVQSIVASDRARRVVATERNPRALDFARLNLEWNGIKNTFLVQNDSLLGLRGCFESILMNPPYGATGLARRPLAASHDGGTRGDEEVRRALEMIPSLLASNGRVIVVGTFPSQANRLLLADPLPRGFMARFASSSEDIPLRQDERRYLHGILEITSSHTGGFEMKHHSLFRRGAENLAAALRGVRRGFSKGL